MSKICIYGAGSLGTILGAYLAKSGLDVDLVNRNKLHVEALNKNGAVITGKANFTQKVNAMLPEEMKNKYDVIILMTKQQDNHTTVKFLKDYLSDDGILCTCQNGIPELMISKIIGEDRTYGCTIGWGATLVSPGVSELTSEASRESLSFDIGKLKGGKDDNLILLQDIFSKMGDVKIDENFIGARWSKLLINAAFSGLGTVLGATFGEVANNKQSRRVAQSIIKECIDICEKANIKIEPIQGHDVAKLLNYKSAFKKWISFLIIPIAMKKHALIKPSMLQDIENSKLTEVDAINGVVVDFGKEYNVPTPYNSLVTELIHKIENKIIEPSMSNINYF